MQTTSYWMLECYRDAWTGGRSIEAWPEIVGVDSWIAGARFPTPPTTPIKLFWDPNDEDGPAQPLYKPGIPMMTQAIFETMQRAGVDNIDVYGVEIHSHNKTAVDRNYVAFNVIGLVLAVDVVNSRAISDGGPPLIAMGLDSVVIDERTTRDLPLFRLAENVTAVVVHDRIKRMLEVEHRGLSFVHPADWVG